MLLAFMHAFLHFTVLAANPSWHCAVTHRDPGVAGTYYLYCAKAPTDGVELIDVGRFVPDARSAQ